MQDFNSFSITFNYIISTTHQKIGDLFCPVHIYGLLHDVPDSQSLVLTSNLYANDAVMYEIDYCIHTALICKRRGMF